jgi:VanZ family protein
MRSEEGLRVNISQLHSRLKGRGRSYTPLLVAWTSTALYAGGIFVCSSLSSPPLLSDAPLPHLDKLCHLLAYGGLTLLLLHALRLTYPACPLARLSVWALGLAVSYGVLDELHQAFVPGRMISALDILADAVGASVVASLGPRLQRRWPLLLRSHTYRRGGADCMPRTEYCFSCGSEIERYEFNECKACHEYFCADCVNEEELCDQCWESAPREEEV